MKEYLTEIINIKYHTLNVVEISVRLVAPDDLDYFAGQGMQWNMDGEILDIAIASPPQENNKVLNFCLKISQDNSNKKYIEKLVVGQKLSLQGPVGDFKIESTQKNLLLIAESTGIGVFSAIIPGLLLANIENKIKLLFQVKSEEDIFFFARFSKLALNHPNFTFTPIVVRPVSHWPGEVGTASTFVRVSGKNFTDYSVYLSGHKLFVETLIDEWRKVDLDKKDIYPYILPDTL